MAEYIKREDALFAALEGADKWDGGSNYERDLVIEEAINRVPTADVVPRVELDAMRSAANSYKMHYNNLAREIMADMRELIKGYENIDVYLDRIEKKYTEGE